MECWIRVAGGAGCWEDGEDCIRMTFSTRQPGMCTGKWELGERVVERCGKPAVDSVTSAAPVAKLALVGIILCVAGRTALGGRLHVPDCAGTGMACSADQWCMFPGQVEGNGAMVEVVTVGIDSIVAGKAVISISL